MPGGSSSSSRAATSARLPLLREFRRRITTLWQLKAWLLALITIMFSVPYFVLGNHPVRAVHDLPMTWIDRAIGFHPKVWVWVYQSFYLPVNLVPWLAERREDLRRYVKGFAIVSLVSFLVFIVYPVRSPRGTIAHANGMHRLLLSYDPPLNALPSLHAGLMVYTLAFGRRILQGVAPVWMMAGAFVWGALALYATLATKEHYLVDVISASVLALAADAATWSSFRKTGRMSHIGRR